MPSMDGACEVDMVLNVGAMKSGLLEAVRSDVAAVGRHLPWARGRA